MATLPATTQPSRAQSGRVEVGAGSFEIPPSLLRRGTKLDVSDAGGLCTIRDPDTFLTVEVLVRPAGTFDRHEAMRDALTIPRDASRKLGTVTIDLAPKLVKIHGVEAMVMRESVCVADNAGFAMLSFCLAKYGHYASANVSSIFHGRPPQPRHWRTLQRVADEVIKTWRWRWDEQPSRPKKHELRPNGR